MGTGVMNRIMFIGEAPGATENRQKMPFVGRAGVLLRNYIRAYSLFDHCYITNVIKCQPPNNRKPNSDEIGMCTVQFLMPEITNVAPEIIVLLGKTAMDFLYAPKQFRLTDIVNTPYLLGNTYVMTMFHPSYIVRTGNYETYFKGFNILSSLYRDNHCTYVYDQREVDKLSKRYKQKI
jgi:DNA polymerase